MVASRNTQSGIGVALAVGGTAQIINPRTGIMYMKRPEERDPKLLFVVDPATLTGSMSSWPVVLLHKYTSRVARAQVATNVSSATNFAAETSFPPNNDSVSGAPDVASQTRVSAGVQVSSRRLSSLNSAPRTK